MEVATDEVSTLQQLVAHGKKKGYFKEILGPHAHRSEVVTRDSTPGDLKRAAKFSKDTTNYNASMTCSDIHGFLDLNNKIPLGRNSSQYVSG